LFSLANNLCRYTTDKSVDMFSGAKVWLENFARYPAEPGAYDGPPSAWAPKPTPARQAVGVGSGGYGGGTDDEEEEDGGEEEEEEEKGEDGEGDQG
jgi:hypothetical protein